MGLHMISNSNDYGGDDHPATHGRDKAMYQDLLGIRRSYEKWLRDREKDQLPNEEVVAKAAQVEELLHEIQDALDGPL